MRLYSTLFSLWKPKKLPTRTGIAAGTWFGLRKPWPLHRTDDIHDKPYDTANGTKIDVDTVCEKIHFTSYGFETLLVLWDRLVSRSCNSYNVVVCFKAMFKLRTESLRRERCVNISRLCPSFVHRRCTKYVCAYVTRTNRV